MALGGGSAKLSASEQLDTLRHVLAASWVRDWSAAVDGGANIGEWAVVMAERFGVVHAFEADLDNFAALAVAVARDNVVLHHAALLDQSGKVDVVSEPKRAGKHRSRYVQRVPSGPVRATTIDDLRLAGCGLIKLDVEGAEYHALLGADGTIEAFRPALIVEIDGHSKRFGISPSQVLGLIESKGYRCVLQRGPDQVFVHP